MSSPDTVIAEASRRYFNQWASRYDRSVAQIWFRENHRLIVQAVDPPADADILDLGCGSGQLAARLAQRLPHGSVLGIDPAEEMIRVARRQHRRKNLRFEVGSSDAIPADAAAFDVVVSTISFHHWARPLGSLREIARVLRPGGRMLILDFCRDNLFMAALDQLQRWLQSSHAGIASANQMRRYCSRAGFRHLRITKPRWLLMLAEGTSGGGRHQIDSDERRAGRRPHSNR
jgi:ubiquinone/menaquinone biosynthesis C-methylase UbiE